MGLFDFVKSGNDNQETGSMDSVLDKGKDSIKEASVKSARMAIKGSGLLIRKAYELRINVVNEFSNIKPDWGFVDYDTARNQIVLIEKELNEFDRSNDEIANKQDKETLIDKLVIFNSLLPDNLWKCAEITNRYKVSTPFTVHGLLCLKKEKEEDFNGAMDEAMRYYESNGRRSEQPRVSFYITKALIAEGDYTAAETMIKHTLRSYPEDIEAHKLALQLHQYLSNQRGIKIEQTILELLAERKG